MAKNSTLSWPFFSISGQMFGSLGVTTGIAEPTDPPAIGDRGDAALERSSADRVDDEIGAPPVGQPHDLGGNILGRVVDPVVHAVLGEPLEAAIALGGRDDGRTCRLGELDGRHPDPTGAGLDQDGVARLQMAELEEAVVGRPELDRDGRGGFERHAVGDRPRLAGGDTGQLGVRALHHHGDHALTDREALDALADLPHGAARLVPDDVGDAGQLALAPVDQVTALEPDRPDLDQDAAAADLRIGDLVVAEHLGSSDLVIHNCFHRWNASPGVIWLDREPVYTRARPRHRVTADVIDHVCGDRDTGWRPTDRREP